MNGAPPYDPLLLSIPPHLLSNRVAESIDPAGSGVGLGSDGHLGLMVPDVKIRVEGLPGSDRCGDYVFKVCISSCGSTAVVQ